ncbi:endonuclease [Cytobacillus purgationiresistens]|uniref:Endonuclease I n=1 Tax=Cytobacillus purgationiresistens TaxID=863449 RepID=A0ABU0AI34_9BACI|nr:endonuclease [Cytobacillus purgationiresistens]MDQ0270912.1 endonuclease I [Cytobacillus purgationiresistens]
MESKRKMPKFLLPIILVVGASLTLFFSIESNGKSGEGSWSSPFTVDQAIQNQTGNIHTIEGYVIGQPISESSVISGDFSNDHAMALADSPKEHKIEKMIYVQIPAEQRLQFGLKTNADLLGEKVQITGELTAYFTKPGVKQVEKMALDTKPIEEENQEYDENYYKGAIGKTGEELKTALHKIISGHNEISYAEVWEALKQTDEDPENNDHVLLFYTGRSQAKASNGADPDDWNREHIWAKSHGGFGNEQGAGTDLHHLRPTDVSVNGSRGNLDFDNGGKEHDEALGNYYDHDSWEPRDEVKGDVARMLFYMDVRYEGNPGEIDLELNDKVNNGKKPNHGKLSILLEWHQEDPVDDFERKRNDIIYDEFQFNRNPFIDNPEWAEEIWGTE